MATLDHRKRSSEKRDFVLRVLEELRGKVLSSSDYVHKSKDVEASSHHLLLTVFPPIMLPVFLAVADQTIVAASLPAIAAALGDVQRVSWIVLAYLVANMVAAPVYGWLGDVLGRRRLLLSALSLFIAASGLCAVSGSILSLTLARALQGLGGGGLMVLSQALIGESVPASKRGQYQGYLSAVIVCASTFGPVAGGFLTQSFGWPVVFLINLPLGLIAIVLARRLKIVTRPAVAPQFDLPGLTLFVVFIVPLLLAVEDMQQFDPTMISSIAVLFAVSIAALIALLWHELRTPQPLFALRMLRKSGMWHANAMAACSGALLVSEVTLLPIYLHVIGGASPGQIGVLMLPLTATVGIGSLITGGLVSRTGRLALFPSVGQAITALTLVMLAFSAPRLGIWGVPAVLAFAAIFQGTAMPVAQITAQSLAGPKMLGGAAAAVQLARSIGSAVGVALVGAVLFGLLSHAGPQVQSLFKMLVKSGPSAISFLPEEGRTILQVAVTDAFRGAFLAIAVFAMTSAVVAWITPTRRL
jgi:EmrB/QacA subfamily drug resistance transporter